MNRKQKIEELKSIARGQITRQDLINRLAIPLPSWYQKQFDTEDEILVDLKRESGEHIYLITLNNRLCSIDRNYQVKPTWFK